MNLYVRGLREEVAREIKSQAALRGQTLAEYLTEIMEGRRL